MGSPGIQKGGADSWGEVLEQLRDGLTQAPLAALSCCPSGRTWEQKTQPTERSRTRTRVAVRVRASTRHDPLEHLSFLAGSFFQINLVKLVSCQLKPLVGGSKAVCLA